jgi:hypothetical protein
MTAASSFSTRQLQEMFSEMVIKKDASLISRYYHTEFGSMTTMAGPGSR